MSTKSVTTQSTPRSGLRALLLGVTLLGAVTCGSTENRAAGPPDAAIADTATGSQDAPRDQGSTPTSDTGDVPSLGTEDGSPPMTCAAIRNCQTGCEENTSCAAACPTRAPTAARTQHEELQACSKAVCPDADKSCRCREECRADGACTTLADECRRVEDDVFCDVDCQ